MHIDKAAGRLTIDLKGTGDLAFLLQTLIRAKFYDDGGGVDGLLSPLLNGAIESTLDALATEQPDTASYYSGWVAHHHLARVRAVLSSSSDYLSASTTEQQEMMRTALYPHEAAD